MGSMKGHSGNWRRNGNDGFCVISEAKIMEMAAGTTFSWALKETSPSCQCCIPNELKLFEENSPKLNRIVYENVNMYALSTFSVHMVNMN